MGPQGCVDFAAEPSWVWSRTAAEWSGALVPTSSGDRPLYPPLQTSCCIAANRRWGPGADSCTAAKAVLFDHLVGGAQKRDRKRQPQCHRPFTGQDYSITSSARTRNDSGIVRPKAFAVLRLTTRSNLVGNSTGKSLTLAPRKMRSTKEAVRCHRSRWFDP